MEWSNWAQLRASITQPFLLLFCNIQMFKKKQLGPGGYKRTNTKEATPSIVESVAPSDFTSETTANADNFKSLAPEIEVVAKNLRTRWSFMTTDDFAQFDPVSVALSFMDTSSLGRDYNSFTNTLQDLEKAMDGIIKDYHQDFAGVISTFSGVMECVSDASKRAKEIENGLQLTRELFQEAKTDLHEIWIRNMQYTEMLRLMDNMYAF